MDTTSTTTTTAPRGISCPRCNSRSLSVYATRAGVQSSDGFQWKRLRDKRGIRGKPHITALMAFIA